MRPVINFKARGVTFYLDLEEEFTKIEDYSGIGKTFMCDSLRAALNTWEDTGVYPVKDKETDENIKVKIIDGVKEYKSENKVDYSEPNTLYIIDEADIYLSRKPEVVPEILDNDSSYFVFMLRANIDRLCFDYYEKAYLVQDIPNRKVYMKYYD